MLQKAIVPSLALVASARRVTQDSAETSVQTENKGTDEWGFFGGHDSILDRVFNRPKPPTDPQSNWHFICQAFLTGHHEGRHGLGAAGTPWLGQDGCKIACDTHSGCNFVSYDAGNGQCWMEKIPNFPDQGCDTNGNGWSYWRGDQPAAPAPAPAPVQPAPVQPAPGQPAPTPSVPAPAPVVWRPPTGDDDTCGDLDHPSNSVCKNDVEWAFNEGRLQGWAGNAYSGVHQLSGNNYADATLEDFQQFFHCGGGTAAQSCGLPPCSCSNPPCDRCYRGDADSCYAPHDVSSNPYALDWSAEGTSFFDEFEFKTFSHTNGAVQYLPRDEAFREGVIEAHEDKAILRAGNRTGHLHRHSAHIKTQQSWTHFLAVLKFNKAPWGPGVWPAFWMNGQGRWPDSGELDIWEWANDEAMKVSMHTGASNMCDLHPDEVNKCARLPDMNQMDYNCYTWYRPEDPLLGCGPTHPGAYRPGSQWSDTPGVLAVEWAEGFVKVFYIPESEIPGDLAQERPQPNSWDRYIISFFPFASSERRVPGSCTRDPLSPQQLILNIELCGDWAGYTFAPDVRAPQYDKWTDRIANEECEKSHWLTDNDCCSNFMAEPEMDDFLAQNAAFDISYLKVFKQQPGV